MVRPSTDSPEKGEKEGGEVRMGRSLLHLQDQAFLKCEVGSDLEQQRGENFLTRGAKIGGERGETGKRTRAETEMNQGRERGHRRQHGPREE